MRLRADDDCVPANADALAGTVAGLSITDSTVRDSLMTLTTLYLTVAAVVSLRDPAVLWRKQAAAAPQATGSGSVMNSAHTRTESVPLTSITVESGSRTPGLAIALLRRPDGSDQGDLADLLAARPHASGYRGTGDIRHPELGGTSPHPQRQSRNREHCRRVSPWRRQPT